MMEAKRMGWNYHRAEGLLSWQDDAWTNLKDLMEEGGARLAVQISTAQTLSANAQHHEMVAWHTELRTQWSACVWNASSSLSTSTFPHSLIWLRDPVYLFRFPVSTKGTKAKGQKACLELHILHNNDDKLYWSDPNPTSVCIFRRTFEG